MSKRAAFLFLDVVAVGVVLGCLLAPYLKRAACALAASYQAVDLDAEWLELDLEEDRGGLS